jgi:hypothetical protein
LWDFYYQLRGWRSDQPASPVVVQELGLDGPSLWPLHYRRHITPMPGTSTVRSGRVLILPLWFLFIATAALPAWKLWADFRDRLRRLRTEHERDMNESFSRHLL